ncbi:MAG: metal-dependent transcriptional regulator [Lentisphaeria bacterium]|nr:metal-dependent transcriptional regulator [Lentisphaeria bacterium]
MSMLHLTESLEDYLEVIAELIERDGHAHTKEISERMQVKMPSVTGALRQLEKLNCIIYNSRYPVQLTPLGESIAREVIHRHKVLKTFFGNILGLPPETASATACRLEHVVDADTVARFVLFSEAIVNRTDARQLQGFLAEAMSVLENSPGWKTASMLEAGESARVAAFGRALTDPARAGVMVGEVLTLQSASPDRKTLRFRRGEEPVELPLEIAENLWVKPPEEE